MTDLSLRRESSGLTRGLPEQPGVYVFHDATQAVLYVGKAKNLKRRVTSYFQKQSSLEPAKKIMVGRIADLDFTVTDSEIEALLLEATLIKKYHPPYNVVLRDDKNFLYIKIPLAEEFPTVTTTRRVHADKAKYFGPFTSAASVHETLRLLKRLFLYRTCKPHQGRACLDVHLGRCTGPCADLVTHKEYREQVIRPIIDFLGGKTSEVTKRLKRAMTQAAEQHDFEQAASLRDRLSAITRVTASQNMISPRQESFDVVSLARQRDWAAINLFQVRHGKLIQKHRFLLRQPETTSETTIHEGFLEQYYPTATDRPAKVFLDVPSASLTSTARLLKLHLAKPERGKKRQLLRLGKENAAMDLERRQTEWLADTNRARTTLEALSRALQLPTLPERIEAYDISNIQGTNAVGSMVVFEHAMPMKSDYRKFTIRSVHGPNDPAMMAEMVTRRLKRTDWPLPNLLLLDGGKGQLSVVLRALGTNLPCSIVALAKQEEELFVPGRSQPVRLPVGSEELFLLQRVRDEAHRFAISFYRQRHGVATTHSELDEFPGVGPASRKKLLQHFGSMKAIRAASANELASVVGTSRATRLIHHLHPKHNEPRP